MFSKDGSFSSISANGAEVDSLETLSACEPQAVRKKVAIRGAGHIKAVRSLPQRDQAGLHIFHLSTFSYLQFANLYRCNEEKKQTLVWGPDNSKILNLYLGNAKNVFFIFFIKMEMLVFLLLTLAFFLCTCTCVRACRPDGLCFTFILIIIM